MSPERAAAMSRERIESRSPEETRGARRATRPPGSARATVVACIGELGAGKTCFIQGLARGLGVTSDVTSPTFVLVNQYRGRLPVYHLDAYRTVSLTEVADLGIEEMLDGEGVTLIEWADKLLPLLPARTITVAHRRPRGRAAADHDYRLRAPVIAHVIGALSFAIAYFLSAHLHAAMAEVHRVERWLMFAGLTAAARHLRRPPPAEPARARRGGRGRP